MKKTTFLLFLLSLCGYLQSQYIFPVRQISVPEVNSESITIDGQANELSWSEASEISEFYNPMGVENDADFSGYLKLCMDYDNLYIFVKVFDDIAFIYDGVMSTWDYDNIEVFLDLDTSFNELYYTDHEIQYRFDRGGDTNTGVYPPRNAAVLSGKMFETSDGYSFEVSIPWLSFMPDGSLPEDIMAWFDKSIGFDVQIADNDGGGRDGQAAWDSDGDEYDVLEDNAWFDSNVFGILKFILTDTTLVADAGEDLIIDELSLVMLDGSSSYDPDDSTLTYQWIVPDAIVLNNERISNPTFMAPEVEGDTTFSIRLIVNDGKYNSLADSVNITVLHVNKAPFANAGADQDVLSGSTVILDGSLSSDFENSLLTYTWTAPDGIVLSDINDITPYFSAPELTEEISYDFVLIVSDEFLESEPDTTRIDVKLSLETTEYDNYDIKLYPNPASNRVSLDLKGIPSVENLTVRILGLSGTEVMKQNFMQDQFTLDLTGIKQGLYILEISGRDFIFRKEISIIN